MLFDKITNIKIYSQKILTIPKRVNQKQYHFQELMLSQKMELLNCFCLDCQSLNVNQLYYILTQNTVTLFFPKFKPPDRA